MHFAKAKCQFTQKCRIFLPAYIYLQVCWYIFMYLCTCLCISAFLYICIHMHTFMYVYVFQLFNTYGSRISRKIKIWTWIQVTDFWNKNFMFWLIFQRNPYFSMNYNSGRDALEYLHATSVFFDFTNVLHFLSSSKP